MSLTPDISARDHHQGPLTAPLIIVHYGDFECPYSGALAPVLAQIGRECSDEMCLIFRPFPLPDLHPHAFKAALAAEAAGDSFWEMHALLFQNQRALKDEDLVGYAQQLGLQRAAFADAMQSSATRTKVKASMESGHQSGAHGTPTVFINGEFYDNDQQLWKSARLERVIQAKMGEI